MLDHCCWLRLPRILTQCLTWVDALGCVRLGDLPWIYKPLRKLPGPILIRHHTILARTLWSGPVCVLNLNFVGFLCIFLRMVHTSHPHLQLLRCNDFEKFLTKKAGGFLSSFVCGWVFHFFFVLKVIELPLGLLFVHFFWFLRRAIVLLTVETFGVRQHTEPSTQRVASTKLSKCVVMSRVLLTCPTALWKWFYACLNELALVAPMSLF